MGKERTLSTELWTTQDLAARYQVPLATIYKWNAEGTGPRRLRLGRHVRYRSDDVERWEEQQVQGGC